MHPYCFALLHTTCTQAVFERTRFNLKSEIKEDVDGADAPFSDSQLLFLALIYEVKMLEKHKFLAVTLAAIASAVGLVSPDALADRHVSRGQIKRAVRALSRVEALTSSKTDFRGGWAGTFQILSSTCGGFPSQVPFRHAISLTGNRVRVVTSHDGTLFGQSRDKGRRIEVARQYVSRGVLATVGVGYANLRGNNATAALAVDFRKGAQVCAAIYRTTSANRFL